MKKYFLIIIINLLFSKVSFTQNEWAPIGAKWTYTQTFYMSTSIDTFTIMSVGDTIIQSHQCKILIKSDEICDCRPLREFMYSDSGKVFFYDNSRNSFQMLYNFNANIGDSIVIYPANFPTNDSIVSIVDSIKTIIINASTLKKLFVHYNFSSGFWPPVGNGVIIENIGDTYFLFPWTYGACDASWAGPLRCYEDTVIGPYNFDTAPSCDYTTVEINEFDDIFRISVFPNPSSDKINIETNLNKRFYYNIYNIFGQLQKTGILQSNLTTISTLAFSNGVYNIIIYADKKTIKKRFIVEH